MTEVQSGEPKTENTSPEAAPEQGDKKKPRKVQPIVVERISREGEILGVLESTTFEDGDTTEQRKKKIRELVEANEVEGGDFRLIRVAAKVRIKEKSVVSTEIEDLG
jgi:hypothetical protein